MQDIPEIIQQVNDVAIMAEQGFVDAGEEQPAVILGFHVKDGRIDSMEAHLVSSFMDSDNRKDIVAHYLNELSVRYDVTMFVSEAWMAKLDKDAAGEHLQQQRVSERPDRIECLLVSIYTRSQQWQATHEIDRTTKTVKEGKLHLLGGDVKAEGRFVRDNPTLQ